MTRHQNKLLSDTNNTKSSQDNTYSHRHIKCRLYFKFTDNSWDTSFSASLLALILPYELNSN